MYAEATPGYANAKSDEYVTGLEDNISSGVTEIITSHPQENIYYDLYGRRVTLPTRGLYIINGKKAMIK